MAAKPASLPRWASDVSADVVEPVSAKKDVGWVSGEEPPAQYENWRAELVYDWLNYLNDGALDGDHSIAGSLTLTGTGDIDGTGEINMSGVGSSSVGGDFDVAGALTVGSFSLSELDVTSFIELGTGPNDVRLESNNPDELNIRLQDDTGNGDLRYEDDHHGDRVLTVPATAGAWQNQPTNGSFDNQGTWSSSGGTPDFMIPIPLKVGDRIRSVEMHINGAGGGTKTVAVLEVTFGSFTLTSLGSNTSASSGEQSITVSSIDHTIVADSYIFARLDTANAGDSCYGIQVTYDRP